MTPLIVFSHLRWDQGWQRPQQLMSRLAHDRRVFFVEESVPAAGRPWLEVEAVAPNVEVLRVHAPGAGSGFGFEAARPMRPLLAEHLRAQGESDCVAWLYTPLAAPLLDGLRARRVVYDRLDEAPLAAAAHAQRSGALEEDEWQAWEATLLAVADQVFVGSTTALRALDGLHTRVQCLPSAFQAVDLSPLALDRDGHAALAAARLQAHVAGPRLGYCGVIDERIDLALLAALADARDDWQIVMSGPVVGLDAACLPQRDNLHWLGMQDSQLLPHLVAAWHVCLMPLRPFGSLGSNRGLCAAQAIGKALQFMTTEKPVVASACDDLAHYGDVLAMARDAGGFIEHCRRALAEPGSAQVDRSAAMQAALAGATWDAVAARVASALDAELSASPPHPASAPVAAVAAAGVLRAGLPVAPAEEEASRSHEAMRASWGMPA